MEKQNKNKIKKKSVICPVSSEAPATIRIAECVKAGIEEIYIQIKEDPKHD